ncbi:TetR family transcriptional regulator [Streptomyces albidoflavus]|nr:TetR/AcrR family transcriptional regulator [Streptomyces albidoflavus]RZD77737.1 TetR family transcriptional regulator [Streptomyces albidoflavus]
MSAKQPAGRKLRADVTRNRTRILDTALRHFTERGASTSLEAIAKDTGVGPATLYRHFPTREALLAAALEVHSEALLSRLQPLRDIGDADEALQQWLLALENYLNTFSGLPEPVITALASHDSPLAVPCQKLIAITDDFLCAAQQQGTARPTTRGRDLFLATLFLAWTGNTPVGDDALPTLRCLLETGYSTR